MQKTENEHSHHYVHNKLNSKWTKEINFGPKSIKYVEYNIDRTLKFTSDSKGKLRLPKEGVEEFIESNGLLI